MEIMLETERLMLRQFTAADGELLYELDSDPAVMRYLTGGSSTPREVIEKSILPAFIHSYDTFAGFGVWATLEKASGDFVGWLSMRPAEGGTPAEVSVGYRLRQAVWGRGYATEGICALIHRGFTELGVQRITASTYEENRASRRVMEKAGLHFERAFRLTPDDLGDTYVADGAIWDGDDVEYALTKTEWEQMPAASSCQTDVPGEERDVADPDR